MIPFPELEGISSRLIELHRSEVPESAREAAKLALLHNLVVAFAARDVRVTGEPHASRATEDTSGTGRRLRDGYRAPVHAALLSNSLLMGARAQHDEHPASVAHYGSVIIPGLLALIDSNALDVTPHDAGGRVLNAMAVGYQAGAALAKAVGPHSTPRGFRPTGLFGPFAGATASSLARGADAVELRQALAFALSSASSLTQVWRDGSDEWRFQTAFAARAGFESAEIAAAGATGATHALEGSSGFARAFGQLDGSELEAVSAQVLPNLDRFWTVEELLLKPYPVCAINQSAVLRALSLVERFDINPLAVERVEVSLAPSDASYPGIDWAGEPRSLAQAMMSLPHAMATALVERTVEYEHLMPPYHPLVGDLARRVSIIADPAICDDHAAIVRLRLRSGETIGTIEPASVPRSWEATSELMHRLSPYHRLSEQAISRLVAAVRGLDGDAGLPQFVAALYTDHR